MAERSSKTRLSSTEPTARLLFRLYGQQLDSKRRNLLKEFVQSKRSIITRLRYGLSEPVVRGRNLDALVVRP